MTFTIEALEDIKTNFLFFLEHTSDFIYFKDKEHRFTYTSNAFARLTRHENWQQLVGKTDFDIFPKEHASVYFEKEKLMMQTGEPLIAIEEPYYDLNGKLRWVSSSKRPMLDAEGNVVGLFGISRDITKIKLLEKELSDKANFDSLTKLANRSYFMEQAESLLEIAKRNEHSLHCLFIDLDGFKAINDNFGHDAGDFVLMTLSNRFNDRLRNTDLIGRLGGDEFAIITVSNEQHHEVGELADVLRDLTNQTIRYKEQKLHIGCSIGISSFPNQGETIKDLLFCSDKAMYQAKQQGKNRIIFYQ